MALYRVLILVLACLLASPVSAAPACHDKYAGAAPTALNEQISHQTRSLCYSAFALLHSGITRGPLWVAEHLTRADVAAARSIERTDNFHADPGLPVAERSEIEDYVRSGFDRGHMAPAGNMPDETAMEESFTLANIVPQNPGVNRGLWSRIESSARGLATRHGEIFLVTGALFEGRKIAILNDRVLVPTALYKAVYIPATGEAAAWLVSNSSGASPSIVSIDEIRQRSGFDPFPSLPASIKSTAAGLFASNR